MSSLWDTFGLLLMLDLIGLCLNLILVFAFFYFGRK